MPSAQVPKLAIAYRYFRYELKKSLFVYLWILTFSHYNRIVTYIMNKICLEKHKMAICGIFGGLKNIILLYFAKILPNISFSGYAIGKDYIFRQKTDLQKSGIYL